MPVVARKVVSHIVDHVIDGVVVDNVAVAKAVVDAAITVYDALRGCELGMKSSLCAAHRFASLKRS